MRLHPDAELLTLEIVRGAVTAAAGTMVPADMTDRLPFVVVRRVAGSASHPRFSDRAVMDVQVWAAARKQAADLAEDIRSALYLAWFEQHMAAQGSVAYFAENAAPVELPDENNPDGVYRFQATYALTLRPLKS